MLHFVTSCMKQNKSRKHNLESAQYGLEISFKGLYFFLFAVITAVCLWKSIDLVN